MSSLAQARERGWRRAKVLRAFAPAFVVIAGVLLFPLLASGGDEVRFRIRFARLRSAYQAIAAGRVPARTVEYQVDPAPPRRIALPVVDDAARLRERDWFT